MQRVVVVGGGVLGMMHAAAARHGGCQVVQLEREAGSRGATVRNCGLGWVSGRATGAELAFALCARELWEELAAVVPGRGFRSQGSVTLAAADAEASPGRYLSQSATTCLLGALAPDMPGCPGGRRSRSPQAPYATTAVPGTAGRVRLAPQRPAAADAGAQLLLAQRLDGSLTIGDTHAYDEPFAFDVDEAPYHHCAPGLSSCSGRRCRRRGGGGPAYTAR